MKLAKLAKTKGETYYIKGKKIPKGCKYCLKGSKVVLFLNGICQKPDHCFWYCPISEERKNRDITFADEIQIKSKEELIQEINIINAKGMSITGGEPLSEVNLEKTIDYIKYVKKAKGKKFHIHLYTNGMYFDEKIAKRLSEAGLDELRFHPAKDYWVNIKAALNQGMNVGAEVPAIPENKNVKLLEEFIYYLDDIGVDFINLNEFEYCFPNSQSLKDRGFKLKKDSLASVVNSRETAINLIQKLGPNVDIKLHFCSIRAKDYHQLKNRYLHRAKNIKLPYEVITEEGLLIYAQIEGDEKNLAKFYERIKLDLKFHDKILNYDKKSLKMPFYIAIKDQVIKLIESYELKGYVIEITPFRDLKYQQITEKTPINVFKIEYGFNGNK
ncbi:MAG: radical SAM protein [Promethearchaeota archaeon]